MYTTVILKVRAFQLSRLLYINLQNYPNGGAECLYYVMYLMCCVKVDVSLEKNEDFRDMT